MGYQNQGRRNEVEQLNIQVMEMRKKQLSTEHPHILTSMEMWQAHLHHSASPVSQEVTIPLHQLTLVRVNTLLQQAL